MLKIKYNGTADIYVTEKCNMNCHFCSARKLGLDVKVKDFKKYVDSWCEYGIKHINITGGEPLLHPSLPELLEYAYFKKMEVALFTNASLLHNDKLRSIIPYISWLAVSIDGNDKTNLQLGRGNNHMSRTLEIVQNIKTIYPNVLIRVASIVTKINRDGIIELGEQMIKSNTKPDLWRIKQLIPVRRAIENWVDLSISDNQYEEFVNELTLLYGDEINIRSNSWKSKSGDLIVTYPDGISGVTIIKDLDGKGKVENLGNIFLDFETVINNWEKAVKFNDWAANNYKEEAWGI